MAVTLTDSLINAGLVRNLTIDKGFYAPLFSRVFNSSDDKIVLDSVWDDQRQVAEFVEPQVVAVANSQKPYEVKVFTPPYVKEKDNIEAWNPALYSRLAGEDIGGQYSPKQREQFIRAKMIQTHRQKITNRIEQMCASALVNGSVVIDSPYHANTTISFNRAATLTIATPQGGVWKADGTVDPRVGISAAREAVYNASGANVDTLIMGRAAFAAFYAYMSHPDRKGLLDVNMRGTDFTMNLMHVGTVKGVTLAATFTNIDGTRLEVYVDNRKYLDRNGQAQSYIGDKQVVGIDSAAFVGIRAFGAIKDEESGFVPMQIFHKEFVIPEPSARVLLSQSAPLPIVANPNATFLMVALA